MWGLTLPGGRAQRFALVRVHCVEGRGPFETAWESEPTSVVLSECSECGLIEAAWDRVDPETLRIYRLRAIGASLDTLAFTGSAPPCEPGLYCRGISTELVGATRAA